MRNPDAKVIASAAKALENGATLAAVMEATGLNHSQVDLINYRRKLSPEQFFTVKVTDSAYDAKLVAFIKNARTNQNLSWGKIAILTGLPESRVRKLWTEGTGVKSQGLRNGRGGRWLYNEHRLYVEDHKKTGTMIPVEVKTREGALQLAAEPVKPTPKKRAARKATKSA